ncbi:hypothetical protein PIB30_078476, partial [Stylosanthes scabra]|nr:hypothetical protein [Stylosanthes scabra]
MFDGNVNANYRREKKFGWRECFHRTLRRKIQRKVRIAKHTVSVIDEQGSIGCIRRKVRQKLQNIPSSTNPPLICRTHSLSSKPAPITTPTLMLPTAAFPPHADADAAAARSVLPSPFPTVTQVPPPPTSSHRC